MITISTKAHITIHQPFVMLKGVPEGIYDVVVVLQPQNGHGTKPRIAGFSKAKFDMSPDFNQPLEDFKDYME